MTNSPAINRLALNTRALLIAIPLLLSLVACGGAGDGNSDNGSDSILPTPMVLIDTPTPIPTNSMALARGAHTATRLQDGRILIAGGDDGSGRLDAITDSSELFNPATGRWESAGVMGRQRTQHIAALLNDGRLVLAGGAGVVQAEIDQQRIDQPLIETDIFNPSAGTWELIGEISVPRDGLAAATLPNGAILITGGDNGAGTEDSILNSAEILDTASGLWSLTGSMAQSRQGHSATLMNDGTVLIAGGDDGANPLNSAEIYDPSAGIFTDTANMAEPRERFTATPLQDGRVLVAGGGGNSPRLSSAEIYDPQNATWTPAGEMSTGRLKHAATPLQDGRVLVVGGLGVGQFLSSAEIYDPQNATWTPAGSLKTGRGFHTATLAEDGAVIVTGGFGFNGPINSTEIYDPSSNSWTVADPP